jgi:hypothetical protein
MSQNLNLKNSEALRAIGMVIGVNRTATQWLPDELGDARAVIRAGLRKFFHPSLDGEIHQWRFLERPFTAVGVAPFETGTISAVDGEVTLDGGTLPPWAADAVLRVEGQTYYVSTVDSTTEFTVSSSGLNLDPETAYSLHRWRYPLPADYGEIIDNAVYSFDSQSRILHPSDAQEIRLRLAVNFQVGRALKFAVETGSDNDGTSRYVTTYPIFDDGAFATTTYRAEPLDKLDDTDLTAEGDIVQVDSVHAETLLAAIMAAAEEYMNDEIDGAHGQRYLRLLSASINHDRHSQGPVSLECPPGGNARNISLFSHVPEYLDLLP